MTVQHARILERVVAYYAAKFRRHGATALGVDWNGEESQRLRFLELLRICEGESPLNIVDYGCGYGALVDHLVAGGRSFRYAGFDAVPEMVAAAVARHGNREDCRFVEDEALLEPADYAVASGVFNVRLDVPDEAWREFLLAGLERLDALGRRGFAFNALSRYSDVERQRPDLFYADPLFFFDHCKRRFSPRVALLHDYPLYEFTILVRKREHANGEARRRWGG